MQNLIYLKYRTPDDILNLVRDSSKILDRSVKIISAINRTDLKEIFSVSYKQKAILVDKVLNEAEYNVNPSDCLDTAKSDNRTVFVICIGILNILAGAMISDNSLDAHTLDVREVGSMKFCSYAFSPNFPYTHLFSRKISQLVNSGIPDHWVEEVVRLSVAESRKNGNKTQSSKHIQKVSNSFVNSRKQDPVSFHLRSMTVTMLTSDCVIILVIFCLEILLHYRRTFWCFVWSVIVCILKWARTLLLDIHDFMWETNHD